MKVIWTILLLALLICGVTVFIYSEYIFATTYRAYSYRSSLKDGLDAKALQKDYAGMTRDSEQLLKASQESDHTIAELASSMAALEAGIQGTIDKLNAELRVVPSEEGNFEYTEYRNQLRKGKAEAEALQQQIQRMEQGLRKVDINLHATVYDKLGTLKDEMDGLELLISTVQATLENVPIKEGIRTNIILYEKDYKDSKAAMESRLEKIKTLLDMRQVRIDTVKDMLVHDVRSVCVDDVCVTGSQLNAYLKTT